MATVLKVSDHTRVVGTVMDNVISVMAALDIPEVRAGRKPRPTAVDVLNAAATVKAIDSDVRTTLKEAANTLPQIRKGIDSLSKADREDLEEAFELVRGSSSMAVLRSNLERIEKRHKGKPLAEAATIARQLITDGEKSIYDPNNPFHTRGGKGLPFAVFSGKSVAVADAAGAIVGGLGGAAGGLGIAAAGAVAVGITASTTQAVKDVLSDIVGGDEVPLFDNIHDIVPSPA